MIRRPPRSTRTDTLFPYTSLFRSLSLGLPAAQRFRTEPATILPDRKALVVRTASNGGQLMAIAIYSLPHLDRITSPETALQSYRRSEEHTSELQSLMRISYAVFCLKNKRPIHKKNKNSVYTV